VGYLILGLKRGTVQLYEHDPEWETVAAQTITQLKSIFGETAVDIQHVGSTAIRSIKAKPIIDIAVGVRNFEWVDEITPTLEKSGFIKRKWEHDGQLLYACGDYSKPDGVVTHFIHVVLHNSSGWKNYVRFRDYCNTHIAAARMYEEVKCRLAKENTIDPGREKYLAGKFEVIQKILRKAQVWAYNRDLQTGEFMSNIHFPSLTACLDMAGCPNRCKHCWLGVSPNGRLNENDLRFLAEAFRPFTDNLTVDSWYREPDYVPEYKRLWEIERELSDSKRLAHWELMSVWRAARDPEYVPWLKSLGLKACQVTLFGGREKTDFYTGRKGAYDEIIGVIEQLINAEITPRIQIFINQDNINDLQSVVDLIREMRLDERCANFEMPFSAFVHQGSCDGENAKLYDIRVSPKDLERVPPLLIEYSLKHFNKNNFADIFGKTERELCAERSGSNEIIGAITDTPTFYVDKDFNVYPNITTPSKYWLLGNLKSDGAETVLRHYLYDESPAQRVRKTVHVGDIVKSCGDFNSEKLFSKGDYLDYLVNKYVEYLRKL
jgi:GrpB-like predicted nucleotidyltransferase (UPF0157 family)/MoaA/NifB/PqqE/SkfB family radical SAM enzyme